MLARTRALNLIVVSLLLFTLLPGGFSARAQSRSLYTVPPITAAVTQPFSFPEKEKPGDDDHETRTKVEAALDQLPLYFIENQGQMDERVYYYIQGSDKTLYFTDQGVTFALTDAPPHSISAPPSYDEDEKKSQRWIVKLDFLGANSDIRPKGEKQTEAIFSYFKGSPDQWHTEIPTYGRIVYENLWPGIDLAFYGTVNELKYEFIVHPGADPEQIRLAYRGAERVMLNEAGELEVTTPIGGFTDQSPFAYQDIAGQFVTVPVAYNLDSVSTDQASTVVSFHLGSYDSTRLLVIDPAILVYSGYIGGAFDDRGQGVAVDSEGNAYIVGSTSSSYIEGFPVIVGPYAVHSGSRDAFVAKVRSDGSGLDYCGYIGGSGDEWGAGIAVDESGNAYVIGDTDSSESTFPTTMGPDLTFNGNKDAFVAKVRTDGSGLDYCGYIGGAGYESGGGIAVDESGNAYVTGGTDSSESTFPVTVGPDMVHNGSGDTFVAKIQADGSGLDYCGYIGGSGYEWGDGIAVDGIGNAYVVGNTYSSEGDGFPVAIGPNLTYSGGQDAFVAKVQANGRGLDYCGYIGGSDGDGGHGIAVDGLGNSYVIGNTRSSESEGFPVAVGPDLTYNGEGQSILEITGGGSWGGDAFVAKVQANGNNLDYCGYIGGGDNDQGTGIAVDQAGNAYVVGWTRSSEGVGFPLIIGPDLTYNGGYNDAFVAKVKAGGGELEHCGYIGGSGSDYGFGIATDTKQNAYVVGTTDSSESSFPVSQGPDMTHNDSNDAFVAKILTADVTPPSNPITLTSSSHVTDTWSIDNTVDVTWAGASDAETGLDGYSLVWDHYPTTIPDAVKEVEESAQNLTSAQLNDGDWYFHIRAVDNAGNAANGAVHMGPFRIDTTPPESEVQSLEYATGSFPVWWRGTDATSGIVAYDVEVRDGESDPWTVWLSNTTTLSATYTNVVTGHTYYFRSIARDTAGNIELNLPTDGDTRTTIAAYKTKGQVVNSRHRPVFNAMITSTPPALNTAKTDSKGNYTLYFGNGGTYTFTLKRDGFGTLPLLYGMDVTADQSGVDFVLPPREDRVGNGDWETGSLGGWHSGPGVTPTVVLTAAHTGRYGVVLEASGGTLGFWPYLTQTVSIPITWSHPVLSFMYHTVLGDADDTLLAMVAGSRDTITHSVVLSPAGWIHTWQDLSAFGGQTVTLSFGFRDQTTSQQVYLDEIRLGEIEAGVFSIYLPLVMRNH